MEITLTTPLAASEQRTLARYLTVGPGMLSRGEWQVIWRVTDQLRDGQVEWEGRTYTFAEFYATFVDDVYADEFLNMLWDSSNIKQFGRRRQFEIAAAIRRTFIECEWYGSHQPNSRWLLAFVLYWWSSFATGYTFEVNVLKNIVASRLVESTRDPRQRIQRYAPADIVLGGLSGDIKSSTSFFFFARSYPLRHDFYITRLYDAAARQYRCVVIMPIASWSRIDGEMDATTFPNLLESLPGPAQFTFREETLVVIAYDEWKRKMRQWLNQEEKPDGNQNY